VLKVIEVVRPDISTVGRYGVAVPIDIVPVTEPALVNVAVSCGRGKLSVEGAPVEVVAHALAVQF
jgi:hypothetical protein